MENMREGTVTIGVDYFVGLIENITKMETQIDALERFLAKEDSNLVYTRHISAIFDFGSKEAPKVWTNVGKGGSDES